MIESPPAGARARAGDWLGFPKGAWLIIGVEFWERFSFYGMLSILVLFLAAPPAQGGFGWSASAALELLGAYTFAMYAFPAVGGFFADRVLGRRRAVAIGASSMLIGQILLSSPEFTPRLLGGWHATAALASLHLEFYAALFCLVLGNALMKSTLVVLCGETMAADDPRREAAYAYYYLGISVGATLSGLSVGWAAQAFGWHDGFALAAAGMAIALASYLLLAARWLGELGVRPDGRGRRRAAAGDAGASLERQRHPHTRADEHREALRRIALLAVLASLLCAFSVGWFQLFGSWLLFIERDVDRAIGAFTIPVPWFTSINSAVVIVIAPLIAALWVRLEARGRHADIVLKYTFALGTAALGHVLMYLAARHAAPAALASVWLPVLALTVLAIGEIVAWTATYGVVSRAAPAGFASVAMGAWYLLTLGLGGYLSAFAGRLIDAVGFAPAFAAIAALMGGACLIALLLRAPLSRLAHRANVRL